MYATESVIDDRGGGRRVVEGTMRGGGGGERVVYEDEYVERGRERDGGRLVVVRERDSGRGGGYDGYQGVMMVCWNPFHILLFFQLSYPHFSCLISHIS